jgi:hypothetical protein
MKFKTVLILAALPLLLLAACGDDDDDSGDPEVGRVGSVSENAAVAYGEAGAEGLYDYLAADVIAACTVDQVADALSDEAAVTGWRNTSNIKLDGADKASARVIMVTANGDEEQDWTFVLENDSWRVSSIPGLEECTGQ